MTTEISTQVDGIVSQILIASSEKSRLSSEIQVYEEELQSSEKYLKLQDLKKSLKLNEEYEESLREQAKQQMLSADIKSITLLSGMTVQLNATPGALKIEDESKVPEEYWKEKTTRSIDKVNLKKAIKDDGIYVEGVTIESDFNFIIKA